MKLGGGSDLVGVWFVLIALQWCLFLFRGEFVDVFGYQWLVLVVGCCDRSVGLANYSYSMSQLV